MPEVRTKLAGVFSYPAGKQTLKNSLAGDKFIVQREPTNQYDPNAIAVKSSNGLTLGYVPKTIAADLKDKKITAIEKDSLTFDSIRVIYE